MVKVYGGLIMALFGSSLGSLSYAATSGHLVVAHWLIPMSYRNEDDYRSIFRDDIRSALELGIDGFALDAFSGKQAKDLLGEFITAADSIGAANFKLFLSADMSLGFAPGDIVDAVATYGSNPHYLKINQRPLLSTFGGDGFGDQWWKTKVLDPLQKLGSPVTFVPNFDRLDQNNDPTTYEAWLSTIRRFPSSDGLFNFLLPGSTPFYSSDPNIGLHQWSILEAEENLAKALADSNKLYIAPFMPYYWAVCHPVRQYMEHQGGRGMDNWWTSLITKQNPLMVEIVTWNDYSESTYVQPTRFPNTKAPGIDSMPHLGYYELMKFYVSWFRNGSMPRVTKDAVFFFQRTHRNDVRATDDTSACALGPISPQKKFGLIQDVIYVTTALTAPATLVVKWPNSTQQFDIPAGLNHLDVAFASGTPTLELWRGGARILAALAQTIDEKPKVYNFNLTSGYAIASGPSSDTWLPSDKWKSGFVADWFTQSAGSKQPNAPTSVSVGP